MVGLIVSIILAIVVIGATNVAINLFGRGDRVQAFCAGAIIGVINYFSPKIAKGSVWPGMVFLLIFFIAMLGISVMLWVWWHIEGSNFIEMLPILALTVLVFFTTRAVASGIAGWIPRFFGSVVETIPLLILIGSIGFYLYDLFKFRNEFEAGRERRYE